MKNITIDKLSYLMTTVSQYKSMEDADHVLKTYLALHKDKIGQHWLWRVIERINQGEKLTNVLEDYGYVYNGTVK